MRRVRDGFANPFAKPWRTVAWYRRVLACIANSSRTGRQSFKHVILFCATKIIAKPFQDLIAINKTDQNSHERRETLARMSHDCRETLTRISRDCRETLARMSHDCRTVVRRSHECLATVVRHSRECLTTVMRLSSI